MPKPNELAALAILAAAPREPIVAREPATDEELGFRDEGPAPPTILTTEEIRLIAASPRAQPGTWNWQEVANLCATALYWHRYADEFAHAASVQAAQIEAAGGGSE